MQDHASLWNYLKDLYQTYGFRETTDLAYIKQHYYCSQTSVNPSRIVLAPRSTILRHMIAIASAKARVQEASAPGLWRR